MGGGIIYNKNGTVVFCFTWIPKIYFKFKEYVLLILSLYYTKMFCIFYPSETLMVAMVTEKENS